MSSKGVFLREHDFRALVEDLFLSLEIDEENALRELKKKLKGLTIYDAINILDALGFEFTYKNGNMYQFKYPLSVLFRDVRVTLLVESGIVQKVKVHVRTGHL
jgi:hypothetical protein